MCEILEKDEFLLRKLKRWLTDDERQKDLVFSENHEKNNSLP